MGNKNILILDGSRNDDQGLSTVLTNIVGEMEREGSNIRVISLREKTLIFSIHDNPGENWR